MSTAALSIQGAISVGWERGRKYWGTLVGALLAMFVIMMAMGVVAQVVFGDAPAFLALVVNLAAMGVQFALTLGFLKMTLDTARGGAPVFVNLFAYFAVGPIVAYFVATLITVIVVGIGTMLLVIPGLLALLAFFFYAYPIVDEGAGPVEAMKKSAEVTQGSWLPLLGLVFLLGLINMAGALALGLGLLLTIPVTWVAMAAAYDQLSGVGSRGSGASAGGGHGGGSGGDGPGGGAGGGPGGGPGDGSGGGGKKKDLPPGMIVAG